MSNPVENTLAGISQEEIDKIVNERVAKELAAREAKSQEKLDVEKMMAEAQKEQDEKARHDALIKEEAKRVAYLDSVNVDEIEDEVIKKTVATVLAATTTTTAEKCETVERLVMSSKVKSLLAKIESLNEEEKGELSKYSLDGLNNIFAKGERLSKNDLGKAEDAIKVLSESLERLGEKKIAAGMASKVDYDKLPQEKKMAYFAANMAKEMQKQRNDILIKTKERLGVA